MDGRKAHFGIAVAALLWKYKWWLGAGSLASYLFFRGNTPNGKAMRVAPGPDVPPSDSWYIKSLKTGTCSATSCSFVEFDGQGDYINFEQHTAAWKKVRKLTRESPVLLVIYCHGWKNNSQSTDVVKFNDFLCRLASTDVVCKYGYRVHGVYLGWRGNLYRPFVEKTPVFEGTVKRFGGPIVNSKWSRRFRWTAIIQETLSYYSRRRAAEHKVSSVPMARTVYTCAALVKSIDKDLGRSLETFSSSRVLVMGHSFGALMLERALNATCLDPLIAQWSWFRRKEEAAQEEAAQTPRLSHHLPLDFVFFVNSAAPSLYAKTMRDFLTAHQAALVNSQSKPAYTPILISLTSSADSATRYLHPAVNLLSRFYPSLRRRYDDLIKIKGACEVNQSWFYRRTPGHQPLLVDHWLEECHTTATPPTDHAGVLDENLDYQTTAPLEFWAHSSGEEGKLRRWKVTLTPAQSDRDWGRQFGALTPSKCSYWLIRCDKRIIRDHNDIWSDTTMEVYVALYRLVEWARFPNNATADQVLQAYWAGN